MLFSFQSDLGWSSDFPLTAGGLALAVDEEEEEDIYFSGSVLETNTNTNSCWVQRFIGNGKGKGKGKGNGQGNGQGQWQQSTEIIYNTEHETCHSLTKMHSNLLWLGITTTTTTNSIERGYLGRYDLNNKSSDSAMAAAAVASYDPVLLGVGEHPIHLALSESQRAVYVLSSQEIPGATATSAAATTSTTTIVQSLKLTKLDSKLQVAATQEFKATSDGIADDVTTVLPAGLLMLTQGEEEGGEEIMIVVGSTRGSGAIFGSNFDGTDMDGFLTKLQFLSDSSTASTSNTSTSTSDTGDGDNNANGDLVSTDDTNKDFSTRFGTAGDDYIWNLCRDENNENSDDNHFSEFYVVGSTDGSFDRPMTNFKGRQKPRAFVAEIDVKTLATNWVHEFTPSSLSTTATTESSATHCWVEVDAKNKKRWRYTHVYVGGSVENGSIVDESTTTAATATKARGKTDIFVAALRIPYTTSHHKKKKSQIVVNWIQQVGTPEDDRLAGMQVWKDSNGSGGATGHSLLLYGETKGTMVGNDLESKTKTNTNTPKNVVLWTMSLEDGSWDEPASSQPTQQPTAMTLLPTSQLTQQPTASTLLPTSQPAQQPAVGTLMPTPQHSEQPTVADPPPVTKDAPKDSPKDSPKDAPKDSPKHSPKHSLVSAFLPKGSGFQSDMGPTYAGGMVYDFSRHAVYLTGSTYLGGASNSNANSNSRVGSPACFLGHLTMIQLEFKHLTETQEQEMQACSPLAQVYDHLYLAGTSETFPTSGGAGGAGAGEVKQDGMISHFERESNQPDWTLRETSVIQDATIQSPVAVVVTEPNAVFVASMTSQGSSPNPDFTDIQADIEFPNLTTGWQLLYGSNYTVTIQHLQPSNDPSQKKLVPEWTTELAALDETNHLHVSGMTMVGGDANDHLIVVGTVKGNVDFIDDDASAKEDLDGYIVKLDPSDGSTHVARRFDSPDQKSDYIMNVCSSSSEDDGAIYIVGATMGTLTASSPSNHGVSEKTHAFVAKLNAESLQTIWTQQFHVKPSNDSEPGTALAYECSLVPQDNLIYVAGVVKDGATIDYPLKQPKSAGSDDVFVVQLDATTGNVKWLKQLGSQGRESLASSGGILTDMAGDAIVYGDTMGELYRERNKADATHSDFFVVTLSKNDGSYANSVETVKKELVIGIAASVGSLLLLLLVCCYQRSRKRKSKDIDLSLTGEEAAGLMNPVSSENGHGLNDNLAPFRDDPSPGLRPGRIFV